MSTGKHSDAYSTLHIAMQIGMQMWIFSQTPWNDADQNLTICTPQLTRQDAMPAWEQCQPRPCPTPLLPAVMVIAAQRGC